jgi:hypothetical protein
MEALVFLTVVGFIGFIVFAIHSGAKQRIQREELLGQLGKTLDGSSDPATQCASGTVRGTDVRFRYVTRGSGKHAVRWTEVDAELPAKYPLRVFVRKQGWLDQGKIDRGELIDVVVGHSYFDDKFVVEAAPADIARILFDERACSYLLALEQQWWIEVTTESWETKPVLRLNIRGCWLDDLLGAERAVEAMAAIAGRVRDAYVALETAPEVTDQGSPYRPMLDDKAARRAADARLEEVAKLDAIRTEREARQKMWAVVGVVVFVFFWIVMMAASAGR